MREEDQLERLLDRYDGLAGTILGDTTPSVQSEGFGGGFSNADMSNYICDVLEWEFFDIMQPIDFDAYYEIEDEAVLRAASYFAYLRMLIFRTALVNNIGDMHFNKIVTATSELWFRKFLDRITAVRQHEKSATKHSWVN